MKSNILSRLSLRVKFKSSNLIEICVIDHRTGECTIHQLVISSGKINPVEDGDTPCDIKDNPQNESEVIDDTFDDDDDSNGGAL